MLLSLLILLIVNLILFNDSITIIDKRRCDVPEVKYGDIMPQNVDHVYEGDMLVVDCDAGYRPHFMVAKCTGTGEFDFTIECNGR